MKKMIIMALLIGSACASAVADVYDIKMTCRVPVISNTKVAYYKDYTSTTYKGFVEIIFDDNGNVTNACDAIIYGKFAEGNARHPTLINFNILNIFGKKTEKIQVGADVDMQDFNVILAGLGKVKTSKTVKPGLCGVSGCSQYIWLDNASGKLTGIVTDVLCDPCNGSSWTWVWNTCVDAMTIPGTEDVVDGTWSIKFNKTLTEKAEAVGFEAAVSPKIPDTYK